MVFNPQGKILSFAIRMGLSNEEVCQVFKLKLVFIVFE